MLFRSPISTTGKVRVKHLNDATVKVDSPAFTVRGKLELDPIAVLGTQPGNGETWPAGTLQSIIWRTTGKIDNVKLEYSTDAGATYPAANLISASTPNVGSPLQAYTWMVQDLVSTLMRVRISDSRSQFVNLVSAASPTNFQVKGAISNVTPVGAPWTVGEVNRTISWTSSGPVSVPRSEERRVGKECRL